MVYFLNFRVPTLIQNTILSSLMRIKEKKRQQINKKGKETQQRQEENLDTSHILALASVNLGTQNVPWR